VSKVYFSEIEGVRMIDVSSYLDSRGTFTKFQPQKFFLEKLNSVAVSVNPSTGTIRGLHFQIEPFAEEKLISCIQGSVLEVLVDIRPHSASFGKYAAFELSQNSKNQVYVPKGIAHGFQTLVPNTILHYFLTSEYSEECSYSINPFGELNIDWPISDYILSEKDSSGVSLEYAAEKYSNSLNI
jgi:dTDP-4-dehydrorhamnose 3,5-epimerase